MHINKSPETIWNHHLKESDSKVLPLDRPGGSFGPVAAGGDMSEPIAAPGKSQEIWVDKMQCSSAMLCHYASAS